MIQDWLKEDSQISIENPERKTLINWPEVWAIRDIEGLRARVSEDILTKISLVSSSCQTPVNCWNNFYIKRLWEIYSFIPQSHLHWACCGNNLFLSPCWCRPVSSVFPSSLSSMSESYGPHGNPSFDVQIVPYFIIMILRIELCLIEAKKRINNFRWTRHFL